MLCSIRVSVSHSCMSSRFLSEILALYDSGKIIALRFLDLTL